MASSIIIDLVILLLVGLPILLLYLIAEPFKRGFFCNDESLSHPYHDDTVTMTMLVSIGICVPIATILAVELVRSKRNVDEDRQIKIFNWDVPVCIQNIYKYIGLFLFGAACCQLTTDIAKLSIGRLRPHFMNLCKPKFRDGTDCSSLARQYTYIEDFTCSNPEATDQMLREMRMSFPSGHSSFGFFTMLFCAFYLQSRFKWRISYLLRHVLQFSLVTMAMYTALSRISDYKHHWSDVLTGSVIGTFFASLVVFGFSKFFESKTSKEKLNVIKLSHNI